MSKGKLIRLSAEQERDYGILMKFRKEYFKQSIRDASHRSAMVIADSASGVLDYRRKAQRGLLVGLTMRKLAAVTGLTPGEAAARYARRRAAFLVRKLLGRA